MNLIRPLTARLEDDYCSITVANHGLIIIVRRPPTVPCKTPPTLRRGGFGGRERSNGSPHSSPYAGGEMNLPPRMGGVSTPPISLITPFLRDINPFESRNTMIMCIMAVQILYDFFKIQKR